MWGNTAARNLPLPVAPRTAAATAIRACLVGRCAASTRQIFIQEPLLMQSFHAGGAYRARLLTLLTLAIPAVVSACGGSDAGDDGIVGPTPAIRVAPTATPVVLHAGADAQATIDITRLGGYQGTVTLAVSGAPTGVTASFSPAAMSGGETRSVLTMNANANAAPGTYQVTVTGSGAGVRAASTPLTLAVVAPAPGEVTLDGIYLGFRVSGVNDTQYQDYWTFLPDGRVIDSDPYEGLHRPLRAEQLCAAFPCGTYTVTGNVLRIRWAGGEPTVYDIDALGAFNKRGETQKYRPLEYLNGLRLDATFARFDTELNRTVVSLRLTADGRFVEQRLMHYTAWTEFGAPGEQRSELPGGAGTYTIQRNTLALQYDGGPAAYFTIVIPPGEIGKAVPDVIYVNAAPIERVP